MSDHFLALIRTWVPVGVGVVLAWLAARAGVVLDESSSAALASGVTGLAAAAYYALARVLESWHPLFGVLLGAARQPRYEPEDARRR
jgi:uncharacterized membrane protein (DUF441 family)